MFSSIPLLEVNEPLVAPLLRVKKIPLMSCPMVRGFESRFSRVILSVPVPVTKMADAFCVAPPEEVPVAVKVSVLANATEAQSKAQHVAHNGWVINFCAPQPICTGVMVRGIRWEDCG